MCGELYMKEEILGGTRVFEYGEGGVIECVRGVGNCMKGEIL